MGTANLLVLASAPMPLADEISPQLRRRLHRWLAKWGTPWLADSLRVEFSPRLRRAFGRCYQEEHLIRLAPSLKDSQAFLLPEILCHEAAHAAVYELHGEAARPHGGEWEELMRVAGFSPRVRIPIVVRGNEAVASDRVMYRHHCPTCEISRSAVRPMRQWRCPTCVDEGSDGRLVILRERRSSRRHGRTTAPPRRERKRAAASRSSARTTRKKARRS